MDIIKTIGRLLLALLAFSPLASARAEPLETIEAVQAEGRFSADAGDAMLDFMDSSKDSMIRARAAHAFYMLFYDLRGQEAQAEAYLMSGKIQARFNRVLTSDPQVEVRRAFAQTGQVMTLLLPAPAKKKVVAAYVPLFIAALSDSSLEQKQELLAALENFVGVGVLESPPARNALSLAAERERDPDAHARIMDLLATLGTP